MGFPSHADVSTDIVERFTLALMLLVVAFRNLIELSGSTFNFSEGFAMPKSFGWFRGNNVLWTISYVCLHSLPCPNLSLILYQPVLTVMASETLVDWLKHAFITKFNHIRPSVYERYTDVLCRDLASGSAVGRHGVRKVGVNIVLSPSSLTDQRSEFQHTYVDQSPLVARRLGFASLPLAVLAVLIGSQSVALLVAMHAEESPLWTRSWQDYTPNDWTNVAKWTALAILCWGWCVFLIASCHSCLCSAGFCDSVLVVKIILGVRLLTYATRRRAGMEAREIADRANDFGRDPIGEGKEEQVRSSLRVSYLGTILT